MLKDFIKQSLPLLIACGIGEVIVGIIFGGMKESLEEIPGLIVLIPAIIGLRGNIATALGSRLGSAIHLGVIDFSENWKDETRENVVASLFLSLLMSGMIGFLAYITCSILGFGVSPMKLISIAMIAGLLSGIILAFLAIFIAYISFRKGYDPDNVTGPSLATIGDIITIGCIFTAAVII